LTCLMCCSQTSLVTQNAKFMHKTSIYLLTVLTFGMVSFSNAQTTNKMEKNFNAEQKKLYNVIVNMTDAFVKKDIDGVLATYEDGAIVMFEPQKPVTGKDNLRMAFTQFVAMNPIFTYSGHEVYISGDIATHIAPWKMVGHLPDGTKVEQSGLSIAVLRKQANGTWLMIQDNPNGQFLMTK
jgi:ketosteroid isomerase-like protein